MANPNGGLSLGIPQSGSKFATQPSQRGSRSKKQKKERFDDESLADVAPDSFSAILDAVDTARANGLEIRTSNFEPGYFELCRSRGANEGGLSRHIIRVGSLSFITAFMTGMLAHRDMVCDLGITSKDEIAEKLKEKDLMEVIESASNVGEE